MNLFRSPISRLNCFVEVFHFTIKRKIVDPASRNNRTTTLQSKVLVLLFRLPPVTLQSPPVHLYICKTTRISKRTPHCGSIFFELVICIVCIFMKHVFLGEGLSSCVICVLRRSVKLPQICAFIRSPNGFAVDVKSVCVDGGKICTAL